MTGVSCWTVYVLPTPSPFQAAFAESLVQALEKDIAHYGTDYRQLMKGLVKLLGETFQMLIKHTKYLAGLGLAVRAKVADSPSRGVPPWPCSSRMGLNPGLPSQPGKHRKWSGHCRCS